MSFEDALEYAGRHAPWETVIWHDGSIVARTPGAHTGEPHALYSGTKSFWGIAALLAQEQGLLRLDEPLTEELHEWNGDPVRSAMTVAMTVTMTAGYGFGGLGNAVPPLERAIALPLQDRPGETFTYGGIPLQVYGAFLTRRLGRHGTTPHAFLQQHVLAPAGVEIASWRTLRDGSRPFPTGAGLAAESWMRYGVWILENAERFSAAFVPVAANPRYGLAWWLSVSGVNEPLAYASGSGGQGLYVLPQRRVVAVHFGEGASYKHDVFLKRLTAAAGATAKRASRRRPAHPKP